MRIRTYLLVSIFSGSFLDFLIYVDPYSRCWLGVMVVICVATLPLLCFPVIPYNMPPRLGSVDRRSAPKLDVNPLPAGRRVT